jgi:hypothetical protein
MNKNGQTPHRNHAVDYAAAAIEQLDTYCTAHPESPSARRRPKLFVRSDLWIALLGPSIEEGIVGIGPNVAAALRAFDAQYNAGLPNETIGSSIKPEQSFAAFAPDAQLLKRG